MIWLLRIFFSAAFVLKAAAATVSGTVKLMDSREPDVRRRGDYSGVAVWLEPLGAQATASKSVRAKIVQKQKKFVPHVLAIPAGAAVDFPNLDPIFHNAFSNFSGQPFDVGLYAPGASQRVVFKREGIVRVFCNIHPTMSAVIVVVKTPYIAVSGKAGAFSIRDVAPGEYRLHIFHERSSDQTLQGLVQRIVLDRSALEIPPIAISESGYLQVPHKNKYGKDYPPVIEDQVSYPPGRTND